MDFFNKINNSMIVDALKQLPTEETVKYFVWMSHNPTHSTNQCVSYWKMKSTTFTSSWVDHCHTLCVS